MGHGRNSDPCVFLLKGFSFNEKGFHRNQARYRLGNGGSWQSGCAVDVYAYKLTYTETAQYLAGAYILVRLFIIQWNLSWKTTLLAIKIWSVKTGGLGDRFNYIEMWDFLPGLGGLSRQVVSHGSGLVKLYIALSTTRKCSFHIVL